MYSWSSSSSEDESTSASDLSWSALPGGRHFISESRWRCRFCFPSRGIVGWQVRTGCKMIRNEKPGKRSKRACRQKCVTAQKIFRGQRNKCDSFSRVFSWGWVPIKYKMLPVIEKKLFWEVASFSDCYWWDLSKNEIFGRVMGRRKSPKGICKVPYYACRVKASVTIPFQPPMSTEGASVTDRNGIPSVCAKTILSYWTVQWPYVPQVLKFESILHRFRRPQLSILKGYSAIMTDRKFVFEL